MILPLASCMQTEPTVTPAPFGPVRLTEEAENKLGGGSPSRGLTASGDVTLGGPAEP